MKTKKNLNHHYLLLSLMLMLCVSFPLKAQYTCPFQIINYTPCDVVVGWEVDRLISPTTWQAITGCTGQVIIPAAVPPGGVSYTIPGTCCPSNGGQDVFGGVIGTWTGTGFNVLPNTNTQGVNGNFPNPTFPNTTATSDPAYGTCPGGPSFYTVTWFTNKIEIH